MSSSRRYRPGDRFGAIPVEVMESEAWAWLPNFARVAVLSLAGCYTGMNNGGIELTDKRAHDFHLNKTDKNLGLRLACEVKIIKQTVKARRKSGRGVPAKYALTWKPLDHFEKLNFCATQKAGNEWLTATIPDTPIKSRRAAQRYFGWNTTTPAWPAPAQTLEGEHHVTPEKGVLGTSRDTRKKGFQPTRVVHSNPHLRPDETNTDS